jgi:hypothetical protein
MPSLSFAQAKVLLAPYFTSQGPTDPAVGAAINFVNERFISSGQWKGNRFIKNFSVSEDSQGNFYFDTEAGVESVMKVIAVDYTQNMPQGEIVEIMGDWYPFNDAGLGFLPPDYAGDTQIIRQGIAKPQGGVSVSVDQNAFVNPYLSGDYTYYSSSNQYISDKYPDVNSPNGRYAIIKDSGITGSPNFGFVHLTAGSEDSITIASDNTEFPWDSTWSGGISVVNAQDRQRYRVVGRVPENRTMYCIVRRGYVPLVNNNDQLVPSNRNAYRYGIQAFNYENVNELERAQVYWQLAYQSLNEEAASFEEGSADQVDIQTKAFSPSLIQNLI